MQILEMTVELQASPSLLVGSAITFIPHQIRIFVVTVVTG